MTRDGQPAAVRPPLGLPRIHHRSVSSTNDAARVLAGAGASHGTLVTASEQTAGRGRQGRVWSAPTGTSLLLSVIVREPPTLLPLAAGIAVADTVKELGHEALVKWPNDVLIDGRKVAGILAEGRPADGWAVVGIGLNVAIKQVEFPVELQETAFTLGLEATDLDRVLETLLRALESRIGQRDSELLDSFRERDALLDQEISWSVGSRGLAPPGTPGPGGSGLSVAASTGVGAGIDGTGRLIVRGSDGLRHLLDAGEVHLGRPAIS
ncbi:MAG: biotin--[acetyl-CoA-carboxylase] ligase [Actinomycetes bacterium]